MMYQGINSFYRNIIVVALTLTLVLQSAWLPNKSAVSESARNVRVRHKKNKINNYTSQNKFVTVLSPHELIAKDKASKKHLPNGTTFKSSEKNKGVNDDDDDSICFNQCGQFEEINYRSCCNCCTNRLVTVHKMGIMESHDIERYLNHTVSFLPASRPGDKRGRCRLLKEFQDMVLNLQKEQEFSSAQPLWIRNFREVLFVRNLYSTVVSGYTYHKSGRECWLDPFGNPRNWTPSPNNHWEIYKNELHNRISENNKNSIFESEEVLWKTLNSFDSVCLFLNQTTEHQGMAIYMDYGYTLWFQILATYYQSLHPLNFTKLVHFEDFFDAPYEVFRSIYDWFSGADISEVKLRTGRIPLLVEGSSYDIYLHKQLGKIHSHALNGHSANQDDTTREQLNTLAIELDHSLYNGRFAKINELFDYKEPKKIREM